jgi:hypothetical protein
MTALAARPLPGEDAGSCLAADPFSLAEANINPVTGLSTDYLNHFNEAIMLLEMIPVMPECRDDLDAWQPLSYHEHFMGSHLKHRELAIAAYDLADPTTRGEFDDLCDAMNASVTAARDRMLPNLSRAATAGIAAETAVWLKPLVARASAIIHGFDPGAGDPPSIAELQAAIDSVLER